MAIDQSEIKLRKDSGINLNFPKITTENQDILIAGNTIGFFGYTQYEYPGLRNTYGDHDRYFWLMKAVKMNTNFTIMGEIEEKIYYENLFNELVKYKLNFKYTFEETYVSNDYILTLEKIMKNRKNKHFDICLMNPPYLGESRNDYGLPLKFLHNCISISDKVISIQPNLFLFKSFMSKSPDKNEKALISDFNSYYTSIESLYRTEIGFDGTQLQEVGIFYIDTKTDDNKIIIKNKYGTAIYNDAIKITKYGGDKLILEFKTIIDNLVKNDNLLKHCLFIDHRSPKLEEQWINDSKTDKYFIPLPFIRGNAADKDQLTMYTCFDKNVVPKQGKRTIGYINFNTEYECQNCINYLKTDFSRMCLWLLKNDFNLSYNMKLIPWQDFSQDIFSKSPREIDDYLFKKYNISDEIRKHIEEILPDYYNIRK